MLVPLVVVCILVLAGLLEILSADRFVLEINGNPVNEEEFLLLLKANQLQYEQEIRMQMNIPEEQSLMEFLNADEEMYWGLLVQQNIQYFTQLRIRQELAEQYGVLEQPFTYENFLQDMEQRNAEQRRKLAEGETAYGIQEFTPDVYYGHYMTNLDAQTLRNIPDEVLGVEESQAEEYYQSLPFLLFFEEERVTYTLYEITKLQTAPQTEADAVIQAITRELSFNTDRSVMWNAIRFDPQMVSLNMEQLREFVRQTSDGESLLPGQMEIGAVRQVSTPEVWTVLRMEGFTKAEHLSDHESDMLMLRMREEAYQAHITELVQSAEVRYGKKVIKQIVLSMY